MVCRTSAICSSMARRSRSVASMAAASSDAEAAPHVGALLRQRAIEHLGDPAARASPASATNSAGARRSRRWLVQLGPQHRGDAVDGAGRALARLLLDLLGHPSAEDHGQQRRRQRQHAAHQLFTNRNTVVPSAPSANTEASYLKVSMTRSTLVWAPPSSAATAR